MPQMSRFDVLVVTQTLAGSWPMTRAAGGWVTLGLATFAPKRS